MKNIFFIMLKLKESVAKFRSGTVVLALIISMFEMSAAYGQAEYVTPDGKRDITFTPGLRIQPKFEYNGVDNNNDFYISRVRLKGKGTIYNITNYYFEIKLDNVGRFNRTTVAQIENAWFDFPLDTDFHLRTGFFDIPFSRNALTSDSKLLLIDRSMIKDALTSWGLADNTIGLFVHGRPLDGHFSYAAGVFDNLSFESGGAQPMKADGFLTSGRIAYEFLDPSPAGGYGDYQGSYIGKGNRLSVGTNVAFQPKAQIGITEFDLLAWGADVAFNTGPFTAEAEYDIYNQNFKNTIASDIHGMGWYVQGGYLITSFLELAARYQQLDPNNNLSSDKLTATTIGANFYIRSHSLKVQTDYTFKKEQTVDVNNDVFQVQLQLDF